MSKRWCLFFLLSAWWFAHGWAKSSCDNLEKGECLGLCNCAFCITDEKSVCIPITSGNQGQESASYAQCKLDYTIEEPNDDCENPLDSNVEIILIVGGILAGLLVLVIVVMAVYVLHRK